MTFPPSRAGAAPSPRLSPEEVVRVVASPFEEGFASTPDGTIIWWSPALAASTGTSPERALGRPCWEIVNGSAVDGTFRCDRACPLLASAREGRSPGVVLYWIPPVARTGSATGTQPPEPRQVLLSTLVLRDLDGSPVALFHRVEPPSLRYSPIAMSKPVAAGVDFGLTPRQQEVLGLLALGHSTDEICRQLGLQRSTVRNHIQGILERLDVPTRSAAIVKALRSDD
jgi:DNA-binding CsgD family transcriptional regulator